ncbi:MAG: arginine--tRNA ligase [Bacteroidales bacterium]|nr:arginine--tRNA ligase [Bacteroidales bacterium]MDT8430937.1 arginine--tRNA ligase [Bacteroidales bacterium]
MQRIEELLTGTVIKGAAQRWQADISREQVQLQKTKKDFEGDLTLVVFPLMRHARKSPEETARELGTWLESELSEVSSFNVIKGFLNIVISTAYWQQVIAHVAEEKNYGLTEPGPGAPLMMVEYSSPNTNKPLHLGHIRNNLLGYSISRILEANGNKVIKVNLVNDRGIHICKSMLAWQKYGNGETPESSRKKGDKLVGDYYVKFDQEYKKQVRELTEGGMDRKKAEETAPLIREAREMLLKWEADDPEVRHLWETMNGWVYDGFDTTYQRMGVSFDKMYYESETYKLGRELVREGLKKGVLEQEEDGSVWADLTDRKLDRKLLLRSDGTSVYMTQDIGTAHQRFSEYPIEEHIYVVGNEQNYHFQVLAHVLDKLGFEWYDKLYHLSYGMVELPEGKMKSREGTVVDADDLMDEMIRTARQMSDELGKLEGYGEEEKQVIYRQIGMGALKYFILKVDPKKNMLFDPKESIDFNGNTGPFIQYTYARIRSVLRSAGEYDSVIPRVDLNEKETDVIRLVHDFPVTVGTAAREHNPSVIANFMYDLAKEFNQFYHDHSILSAEDPDIRLFRIHLSRIIGDIIERGMGLLGIEVPERM